jgi:CheY-like chemotaxis protein
VDVNKGEKSVFIVDDEPAMIKLLKHYLEPEGIRVQEANSGEDCLKMAGENGIPDMFLIDIMMPKMSGYEVCRRLKKDVRFEKSKCIFFTAAYVSEVKAKFEESGADDYIMKDVDTEKVVKIIKKYLHAGSNKAD